MRVSRRAEAAVPSGSGRPRARAAAWALILVAIAGLAAITVGSSRVRSALLRRTGASGPAAVATAVLTAPVRIARAWTARSGLPRLFLDVKFKHLHQLHGQREEALRTGFLDSSDEHLVPGELTLGGSAVAVRLRLDGSRVEPLRGEMWPLALYSRGDGQVFGMRAFTLRAPEIPAFRGEHALLDHARSEDLVAVRTALVDLTLNGRHLGLTELTEIPSPELFESQQRRDGPVFRFDGASPFGGARADPASVASVLRPAAIARSGKLSRQRDTALRLLGGAMSGALDAGDVFDPVLFGRFIALADLWDAPHTLAWSSLLLYANPLTARLEPVAHPCSPPLDGDGAAAASAAPFRAWLLSDRAIRAAWEAERTRLARDMATDSFAAGLVGPNAARTRLLALEYPLRAPFDPSALLAKAARAGGLPVEPRELRPRVAGADAVGSDLPLPSPGLDEVLAQHAFLRFEPGERMLVARPGRWDVAGWLILPDGVGLRLPPGTTLRFERRRGIIARGPLEFQGEPDAPVVLAGPASRKPSRMWAGVYVVESERPSRWSHTTVRNTSGFRRRGWRLAGGVVFRKTRVEIEDSTFLRSQADDTLNVVRSAFVLRNVRIIDSRGDGFDGDYVEGEISGGVIGGTEADAIDVGGSRVVIRGVRIENVRDKAIVVGERSRAAIEEVAIEQVGIAVASKNGAETSLRGSSITGVADVALAAYASRSEYGPGLLTADGNRISGAALAALAQSGSRISIDGEAVPTVDAAIDRLYKDGETDR